jgi:uncharacterized repeat protein (TIGR03803 family)
VINSDGQQASSLIVSGDTLYGTTVDEGPFGYGTVFAMKTDGTGFWTIHAFRGSDGYNSWQGGLTLSGEVLYGTAVGGGAFGAGTVFAVNTDGTDFRNLYDLNGPQDGGTLYSALVLDGNTLYGTSTGYLGFPGGAVFRINTDGTGFTNLCVFDGVGPWCGVIQSGTTLYGTTRNGGDFTCGTVFAIQTDGTGFTNLYSFTCGADGVGPVASLILSSNVLYGTTEGSGGEPNGGLSGSIFKLNTDGTGFQALHTFDTGISCLGSLITSGGILYGTSWKGAFGRGAVFAINTDGTGFTNLYSFTNGNSPQYPSVGLLLLGNVLYGTTDDGGANGNGTVFALSLPSAPMPQLTLGTSSAGLVISWPANAPNLVLQSTTDFGPGGIWTPVSTKSVVISGMNIVTNPISGTQQFFRLSQ